MPETTIVDTPQSIRPAESKSRPEADRPLDETNWPKVILVAVLGLGLLAGSAYAGYWYGIESSNPKTQISKPPASPAGGQSETQRETPEPPITNWLTFQGTKVEYYISHPEDWSVSEEYIADGGMLSHFSVKKGAYELLYTPPTALTRICVFDDDNEEELKALFEKDYPGYYEQGRVKLGEYVAFGEYRRAKYTSKYEEAPFIVCRNHVKTGFSYIVPRDYDEDVISTMDEMVNSFEWVGTRL